MTAAEPGNRLPRQRPRRSRLSVEKPVTEDPSPKRPRRRRRIFSSQIKRKIIKAESKAKLEIKRGSTEAEQKRDHPGGVRKTKQGPPRPPRTATPKVKHIDADGIASGLVEWQFHLPTRPAAPAAEALTREEADLLDTYFAITMKHTADGRTRQATRPLGDAVYAIAEFRLNADGSISSARITRASGSDEFDRAVIDDLRRFKRVNPRRPFGKATPSA